MYFVAAFVAHCIENVQVEMNECYSLFLFNSFLFKGAQLITRVCFILNSCVNVISFSFVFVDCGNVVMEARHLILLIQPLKM